MSILLVPTATAVGTTIGSSVQYRITQIAVEGQNVELLLSQIPEMTEDGHVFFIGELTDSEGLFLGDGGPLTTVTSWTSAPRTGIRGNALGKQQTNGLGEVVFRGSFSGSNQHIYHWTVDDGPRIVYSSQGAADETFHFLSEPAINSEGAIAFNGSGQGLPEAIFVGDRDGTFPATALAATGGPLFEGFLEFAGPMISNDGTVFVLADKDGTEGIHKLTGPGESVPIAEVGSEFASIFAFDINNRNQVALMGELSGGERAIFLGDEGGLDLIASDNAQYVITNPPGVNDRGEVVFKTEFDPIGSRLEAIMTGPDPNTDRLIQEGDFLLGQPVQALFAGRGSINSRGQIAFYAARMDQETGFSNGGIFLATPIPEPSTAALSALGLFLVASAYRQRVAMQANGQLNGTGLITRLSAVTN